MTFWEFLSDKELSIDHVKAFFLILNGILLIFVGPFNIVSSFHKRIRPFIYALMGVSALMTFVDTAWLGQAFREWTSRANLVLWGLFFGVTFFAAKKHTPILYGAIEIAAGAAGLALVAFVNHQGVPVLIFGAATSIYIVVRGLSNINDALVKRYANEEAEPALEEEEEEEEHEDEADGLEPWEFSGEPEDADGGDPLREPGVLEPWEFPEPEASEAEEGGKDASTSKVRP